MLTFEQAKKIVSDNLLEHSKFLDGDSLVILDHLTIEKPYGWIFYYDSKFWQNKNRDNKYIYAGNVPLLIDKQTGKQIPCHSENNEIAYEYEEEEKMWSLFLTEINLLEKSKLIALKNHMKLDLNTLKTIKSNKIFCLDSGSESRLKILQADLQNISIDTKLIFSRDNEGESL